MDAKQKLLEKIKDGTFYLLTDNEIARLLKLGARESAGLRAMLHSLVKEGELIHDGAFRYGTAEQFGALKGTYTGNERGFGFVMTDKGEEYFIPPKATNGALHGDTVLVIPVKGRSDDEGEIIAVLDYQKEIVGVYHKNRKAGVVIADERKYRGEIFIPAGKNRGCADKSKVLVKITSRANGVSGEVMEILGKDGDFFAEEFALIRSHSLREEFPKAVEDEAKRQESRPHTPSDLKNRVDLRNELIITIDGEDTRDIDDAISVYKKGNVYELGVHIADVTHYVSRNGVIDKEAFARGTSVYFPDRVLPMLPRALSNGICSLNEGVERLTLSCFMTVDQNGKVIKKKISPSVIRSAHRMTYTKVAKIAQKDGQAVEEYPDLVEMIDIGVELTKILQEAREKRGCIDMDIKEAKILYEDGKISIPDYSHNIAHDMIEQFMVLANESVASIMTEKNMPFVYRVHEAPNEDKAHDFITFLKEAGVRVKFDGNHIKPKDYQNLLKSLEVSPIYPLVNRVMLRSMMKARYSPENLGHFGLASACYCHFTSPIRRYPDLCIHRIIKESFSSPEETRERYQKFVEEASVQSSECEKNAAEAERDVDALYIVAYMQDKIGEEFEGVISGVTSFGVFVELDNTIEGFVPLETLPGDSYRFMEERFLLKGMRNSYCLGEKVKVRVDGVDWGARRVQFSLLKKL